MAQLKGSGHEMGSSIVIKGETDCCQYFLLFYQKHSVSLGHTKHSLVFFAHEVAEPHSSVDSVADLSTGGRWFDPRLGQYSFRELMIVIATGLIPLSPLSVVSTMVMWESNLWLGKNTVRSTG